MQTFDEFFRWCSDRGLRSDAQVAHVFGWTSEQTIRNWRNGHSRRGGLPDFVRLQCLAVAHRGWAIRPPRITVAMLSQMMQKMGLNGSGLAGILGVRRQTVNGWIRRARPPRWLGDALDGLGIQRRDGRDLGEILKGLPVKTIAIHAENPPKKIDAEASVSHVLP